MPPSRLVVGLIKTCFLTLVITPWWSEGNYWCNHKRGANSWERRYALTWDNISPTDKWQTAAADLEKKENRKRPDRFEWTSELMELEKFFVTTDASPLWYRGSASCHPYAESFNSEQALKAFGGQPVRNSTIIEAN